MRHAAQETIEICLPAAAACGSGRSMNQALVKYVFYLNIVLKLEGSFQFGFRKSTLILQEMYKPFNLTLPLLHNKNSNRTVFIFSNSDQDISNITGL